MLELLEFLVTGVLPSLIVLALMLAVARGLWDWLTGLGKPPKPKDKFIGTGKDLLGNPLPKEEENERKKA